MFLFQLHKGRLSLLCIDFFYPSCSFYAFNTMEYNAGTHYGSAAWSSDSSEKGPLQTLAYYGHKSSMVCHVEWAREK